MDIDLLFFILFLSCDVDNLRFLFGTVFFNENKHPLNAYYAQSKRIRMYNCLFILRLFVFCTIRDYVLVAHNTVSDRK